MRFLLFGRFREPHHEKLEKSLVHVFQFQPCWMTGENVWSVEVMEISHPPNVVVPPSRQSGLIKEILTTFRPYLLAEIGGGWAPFFFHFIDVGSSKVLDTKNAGT